VGPFVARFDIEAPQRDTILSLRRVLYALLPLPVFLRDLPAIAGWIEANAGQLHWDAEVRRYQLTPTS
jgi:hypothetical protein